MLYPDGKKPKDNHTKTTPEDKTANSTVYQEFKFDTSDEDTQNEENTQLSETEVIKTKLSQQRIILRSLTHRIRKLEYKSILVMEQSDNTPLLYMKTQQTISKQQDKDTSKNWKDNRHNE